MDIEEKLKQIKSRFEEVNAAMSDPSVFDNPEKYTELTKERSDLEDLVKDYDAWKDLHNRQEGNKELIEMDEDAEITEMAKDENKEIKAENKKHKAKDKKLESNLTALNNEIEEIKALISSMTGN